MLLEMRVVTTAFVVAFVNLAVQSFFFHSVISAVVVMATVKP